MKKETNEEIVAKFFEFLRYMVDSYLPDHPNEIELKEGKYLAQYVSEQLSEPLEQYDEYGRLPIFKLTLYGDHKGHSMVVMKASPDVQIFKNWRISELAQKIKVVIDEWDLDFDKPPEEKEVADLTPYMAIKEHIKKK